MSNPANKKKKKIKPIPKPYLKGNAVSRLVVTRGLKLMVYPVIFILINLFVGAAFSFEGSLFLRVLFNVALVLFCGLLLYTNGQNTGYGDITLAEIMYNHVQEGKEVSARDRDRCYHPLKGLTTALVGYLPFLILSLIYALTVQRQQFALPALPSWVGAFEGERDFMLPLQYYQATEPFTAGVVLRVIMRLLLYPYINLVGARNASLTLLVDRLSPLALLVPYLGYVVGYLRGRHSRAMLHGSMAAADRKKRRKARMAARKAKAKSKTELV